MVQFGNRMQYRHGCCITMVIRYSTAVSLPQSCIRVLRTCTYMYLRRYHLVCTTYIGRPTYVRNRPDMSGVLRRLYAFRTLVRASKKKLPRVVRTIRKIVLQY
jgi:hypothetical protein